MYILQHFLCSVNYTFLQMCLIFCIFPWYLGKFPKVKQEITATNEAIKKGVMKGANVKRIPDFQSVK